MDERKKTIKLLEGQKKEARLSRDLLLEKLGEILLGRINETNSYPSEISKYTEEYRRLNKEIADSQTYISITEKGMIRLKELEATITVLEQKQSKQTEELSKLHIQLGKLIMEEPGLENFGKPHKKQIELLVPKIQSLEDRLEKLEDKDGTNVFTWIGKNAQAMVLRSFLENSQESIRRIYGSIGAEFILPKDRIITNEKILSLTKECENFRESVSTLIEEITTLKTECRTISSDFGIEGSPIKRIQDMEKHIAHIKVELKTVYLNIGTYIAEEKGQDDVSRLLSDDDIVLLDEAHIIQENIKVIDRNIEKLKAELAIEEEKVEIEKFKKGIDDHKKRISQSENAISDLERRITESNIRIEKLNQLL